MAKQKAPTGFAVTAAILFVLVLVSTGAIGYLIGTGDSDGAPSGPLMAVKGNADAKVTIVEYSDFQCPYCGKFVKESMGQIEAQYIATGKAKIIFKDYPLSFHPFAQKAAEAGKCILEQGQEKFWKYHDTVFANQPQLNEENIKLWAAQSGVNVAKFTECYTTGRHTQLVLQEMQEGQQAGIQGTPGFLINGKLVSGAQPFAVFAQAIDAAYAGQ